MNIRTILRSFSLILVFAGCFIALAPKTEAAALTVCGSAITCTGTTISGVLTGAGTGDTITVQGVGVNASNPYNPATEAWPVEFRAASNTLVCAGGATISRSTSNETGALRLSTSSTISDCTIANVSLSPVFEIGADGQSPHGIHILNNVFSIGTTSTIGTGNVGMTNFLISGNTNIQYIALNQNATNTRGIISNNTFRNRLVYNGSGVNMIETSASTTNISIINNTFTNVISAIGNANTFFLIDGVNITFASNTFRNPAQSLNYTGMGGFYVMNFHASGTQNYIGGNIIEVPTSTAVDCVGINIQPSAVVTGIWSSTVNLTHNTIVFGRGSLCGTNSSGVSFSPSGGGFTRADIVLNASYNLIANEYGLASTIGAINLNTQAVSSTVTVNEDYNGVYGFDGAVIHEIDGSPSDISNTHDVNLKPYFRLHNSDDSDDFTPAPYSQLLDVNGTLDIGADSAARRSTIYLNSGGTIDYTSVDATNTTALPDNLKSGDTASFAAGSYSGFAVSSTAATTSLTFVGAGPLTTFIVANTSEDALLLTNATSTSVSGLKFMSATSLSSFYRTTKILGVFGGQNYNQGSGPIGASAGDMVFFNDDVCGGPPGIITEDNEIASGLDGTSDIHLVLITVGGARLTALVPDNYLPGTGSVVARMNAACGGMVVGVAAATSTFTGDGTDYSYHGNTLSEIGITLVGGVTTPPEISTGLDAYAGIKLSNSSMIGSNLIFDTNGYGLLISEGSGSSTIMNSTSTGNLFYDFAHETNTTSTLANVSFLTASTTFGGVGGFDVYYNARVRATNTSGTALANIHATATPATVGSATYLGTTDSSGYTAYQSLLAHRLNSSSVSLTNAGKNPYTWATGASGAYVASSTATNLSSTYQTVTLAMSTRGIGFAQSSGSGLESLTATSVNVQVSSTSLSPITVTYTVTGGTATGSGTDYTLASGTATISVGETSTAIPFTIVDDSTDESDETIIITLSSPSGAELGTTVYTYTITDNDDTPVVSGGGGGATSFISAGIPLVQPIPVSPTPVTTNPTPEPAPTPTPAPVPAPEQAPPPSDTALGAVDKDATTYGIKLSAEDRLRLASFIDSGISPETKALGSGERTALIKDTYETIGRAISDEDIIRLAKGEIAKTRNLAREIVLQPRALATFQAIYGTGRKPNFKNPEENLAWNTLMYRIRFPRDLKKEKEGIQEFRTLFRKDPKDPFQWATVRVLGYIEN